MSEGQRRQEFRAIVLRTRNVVLWSALVGITTGLIAAVAAELVVLQSSVTGYQARPQPGSPAR